MKNRPQEPPIPIERKFSPRRAIIELLQGAAHSAKQISTKVGLPEKQVYGHLEHVKKTLGAEGKRLVIKPAVCNSCGFIFKKRERLKAPSRCPLCRGESIQEPTYQIL